MSEIERVREEIQHLEELGIFIEGITAYLNNTELTETEKKIIADEITECIRAGILERI